MKTYIIPAVEVHEANMQCIIATSGVTSNGLSDGPGWGGDTDTDDEACVKEQSPYGGFDEIW